MVLKQTKQTDKILKTIIRSNILVILLLLIILLEFLTYVDIDDKLHLYFLDIGQGDSILIKTPQYRYILVDGGEDKEVLEELGEVMPYWKRSIDVVIGTHADADHIGGLVFVLEKYEVHSFLTSDLEADDNNLDMIKDIAVEKDIILEELNAGDIINVGELRIDVLWPERDIEVENDNQNSVVLEGNYDEFTFLLTGDIESEQEKELILDYHFSDVEILKASHHGSKTASSDDFLEDVNPEIIVISCGEDNKFGHPATEVIERIQNHNIEILRTDVNGRIEFVTDGNVLYKKFEK